MADIDGDGVLDAAVGELRMQLYAANRAAQAVIRLREEHAEAAKRRELEKERELQRQLAAEQAIARAELAPVSSTSWWNQAEPADVARVYERAIAWRDVDPEARTAEERIRNELRERYNIEVQETAADPIALRSAIEYANALRDDAADERLQADRDRQTAVAFMAEADGLELAAEGIERRESTRELVDELADGAALSWDSAERRDAHAAELERAGHLEAAAAWKQADLDQAKHPREAIARGAKKSPKARAGATAQPARQAERGAR